MRRIVIEIVFLASITTITYVNSAAHIYIYIVRNKAIFF